ncbi:hypothetical protein ULMS_13800 [Patiriisocius marinistellae]|uniref:Uncharacterized protein n=1 Tax=Patiriisocius marinistellae TaxID=2494560 RepID=A0A5J4FXJ1_9FLAO|nr:DUF6503 family protein [Patiriisocius marinistellae]GEQ85872.1 hypothetical protein ULMS_13800 [Patiriisocius marinistellae]
MKKILLVAGIAMAFTACKNETKENINANDIVINDTIKVDKSFPASVAGVMKAHGGFEQWNKMNNLCFEIDKNGGVEAHTTSLKDRKAKIEHKDWTIGFDGNDAWLLENEKGSYEGNARFYHNLMFYFYAMPFVLADDGITYTDLPETEIDGEKYKGIKISYGTDVGDSPKDEYALYFDPSTNQMVWLGYTVTYNQGEKSDKWSFIKYDKWQKVNGLMLPEKLTWYNVENGLPTSERKDMLFSKVTATETILENKIFARPQGAIVVPK